MAHTSRSTLVARGPSTETGWGFLLVTPMNILFAGANRILLLAMIIGMILSAIGGLMLVHS